MHTASQQLRGVGVAKVMKPYAREATYAPNQIGEFVGQARRLLGLTINPTADQRVARLTNAHLQQGFGLGLLMPAQFRNCKPRQCHATAFV
jgi:hypothetical protein